MMRLKFVFILIVIRMTTSFFLPASFQRYASHCDSQTVLSLDRKDCSSNHLLESLDFFVTVVESLNQKHGVSEDQGEIFKIVSRGSNDLPKNVNTETKVFYDPDQTEFFIVIFQEEFHIDVSKIYNVCSNDRIVPVPTDIVQSLSGFPTETLPPLGLNLEQSISSCTIILDEGLIDHCQGKNLCMISGAGHPYWKLLLREKAIGLLKEMDDVKIADIVMIDDKEDEDYGTKHEDGRDDQVWEVSFTPESVDEYKNKLSSTEKKFQPEGPKQFSQKPYFPIDGPSINIAQLVIREKTISNPLSPVFLTAVGRIGHISIRTKRSLRCEFLPPARKNHNTNEINEKDETHPWKSATRSGSMIVNILFGKVFLQSFGTKQGVRLIETMQEGQLLQIEAKTNPGQRESIEKWVDEKCLELTMIDCQLLSPRNDHRNDSDPKLVEQKKKKTYSSLPTLALDNIFDKYASIKFVDNIDFVLQFSNDVSKVLSRSYTSQDSGSTLPFVGIDCEWQPREFMENPNLPQPVLLLQISFHELQNVYLLDLQTLLRPLKPPNEPLNGIEKEISNALSRLMKSKQIIKVGYQLSSDIRRIFASYPHLPCFQEVHSTLEISSFIKRILHITKQKKSRYITMSLAAMTSHYLGMTLDKKHQLTDWAERDLTPEQVEYAALDAAVTPKLLEKVLESIEARVSMDHLLTKEAVERERTSDKAPVDGPVIQRWDGDDALVKEIVSLRFLVLPESTDETTIVELQAKQIVGSSWIVSSMWTAVEDPPAPYVPPPSSRKNARL